VLVNCQPPILFVGTIGVLPTTIGEISSPQLETTSQSLLLPQSMSTDSAIPYGSMATDNSLNKDQQHCSRGTEGSDTRIIKDQNGSKPSPSSGNSTGKTHGSGALLTSALGSPASALSRQHNYPTTPMSVNVSPSERRVEGHNNLGGPLTIVDRGRVSHDEIHHEIKALEAERRALRLQREADERQYPSARLRYSDYEFLETSSGKKVSPPKSSSMSPIGTSAGRRNAVNRTSLGHTSSSASSAGSSGGQPNTTTGRQRSRFNGPFQSLEKTSLPSGSSEKLLASESNATIQSLFSPQSFLANSALSITAMINDDPSDETGQLLNDPVTFAKNGENSQMAFARRTTNPQLLVMRFAGLSLLSVSSDTGMVSPPQSGFVSPRHNYPPVNPADQNPPCNTLYVGNLPVDTSEDELKAMFSKRKGFKRLCFRVKQNGPMCFVEFEDTSYATKALDELYGHPLHNSVKGGMRLSFSKNPLGVRCGQPSSNVLQSPFNPHSGMQGMGNVGGIPPGFNTTVGPPPGLSAPPGLTGNLSTDGTPINRPRVFGMLGSGGYVSDN
jgi:hypothetical protein